MRKVRRYKIQRRVELRARDLSNKPFLFGTFWRTVAESDSKDRAQAVKAKREREHPDSVFRVLFRAGQWPMGSS